MRNGEQGTRPRGKSEASLAASATKENTSFGRRGKANWPRLAIEKLSKKKKGHGGREWLRVRYIETYYENILGGPPGQAERRRLQI